ncbi:hypothetical protein [Bradyrhizobium sp. USDA 4451]
MGLIIPRNRLVYPGFRAEINRDHPAYTPHLRYVGVPVGNSFVNLLTGKGATVSGSPVAQISPLQGAGVYFSSGAGLTATGIIDTPVSGVTMAAIVTPQDASVTFGGVFYTGNGASSNNDYGLTTSSGLFKIYTHGNVQAITGFPSYVVGRPYFVAMSEYPSASVSTACWAGVMVDLLTGETWSGMTFGVNALTTPAAATFYIGGQATTHASLALISAVMYSADAVSPQGLLAWGADPWAFWYAGLVRRTAFSGLASPPVAKPSFSVMAIL